MAEYRTGRNRKLSVTMQMQASGREWFVFPLVDPFMEELHAPVLIGGFAYSINGIFYCSVKAEPYSANPSSNSHQYGVRYSVFNGFASDTFDDLRNSFTTTPGTGQVSALTISDDATMTIDVEEWVAFGTIEVDSNGKFTIPVSLYERAKIGGEVTAEVGGASVSTTITLGMFNSIGTITYGVTAYAEMRAANAASAVSQVTPSCDFGTLVNPGKTKTYTGSIWTVNNTGTSTAKTEVISNTMLSDEPIGGISNILLYPIREAQYEGVIRAFDQPYPDTIAVIIFGDPDYDGDPVGEPNGRVISASSSWSATITQDTWDVEFWASLPEFTSPNDTYSLDERQSLSQKLQAAALLTAGEDGGADEAYIRGHRWTVGSFSQQGWLRIAETFSLTDDTPYTMPDADTQAGAIGSHPDFWGSGFASMDGFRYVQVNVLHDDPGSLTLSSIEFVTPDGSKTWSKDKYGNALTVPTGGGYQEIVLDLCNPDATDPEEKTDTQDTCYPINRADSWAWGVTKATGFVLNGIPSGVTFEVQKVELVREGAEFMSAGTTLLTVCPTYSNPVDQDTLSPNPTGYRNDFLRCETDGKTSLQQSDIIRSASPPYAWSSRSIETVKDWIMDGTYPSNGFSMTANALPGVGCPDADMISDLDCLLNETAPAWCLWGSGAWYDGEVGNEWKYAIDLDVSTATDIVGQMLATQIVSWYPGCGDAFELGAFGGALKLRCASFLRGRAHGLTLGFDNEAAPDVPVVVSDGRGDGTSDDIGFYRTGLPFAKGGTTKDVTAQLGETPYPDVTLLFPPRKSLRAVFRVGGQGGQFVWTMRDYTERFFLFKTNSDGELTVLIYDDYDSSPQTVIVDTDTSSSYPSYHLVVSHIVGTHLRDTTVVMGFSGDHGGTWDVAAIDNAISAVAIISAEQLGRLVVCYYHEDEGEADTYDSGWYVQVGKLGSDGAYTWSDPPISMGITDADKYADLLCRDDSVLQFTYLDMDGNPHLKYCYNLDLDGNGDWQS